MTSGNPNPQFNSLETMYYRVNANKTFVDKYDAENPHLGGYARDLKIDGKYHNIKANFNWFSFTPVILSDRSHLEPGQEKYAIIDGQRRITIAKELYGNDVEVNCIVYLGLTQAMEARIYNEINGYNTNLSAVDKYMGKLHAGSLLHMNVQKMLNSHRLKIGKNITAVETLIKIYQRSPDVCSETLRILRYAWHKQSGQFSVHSMSSVFHFLKLVPQYRLDTDRLIKKMQDNSPSELRELISLHKRLKTFPGQGGSNTAGAEALKTWYNSHLRKGQIKNDFHALNKYSEEKRLLDLANSKLKNK